MRGKVTVGDLQQFFKGVEIIAFVRHQHTHDLEPDPVFKCLIEMIQGTFHLSYLKCMIVPYTIWRRPNPIAHKIRPCRGKIIAAKPNKISQIPSHFTSLNVYSLPATK